MNLITRKELGSIKELYKNSDLVFNLKLTKHKIQNNTQVIFRGLYIPSNIIGDYFDKTDLMGLRMLLLGLQNITINLIGPHLNGNQLTDSGNNVRNVSDLTYDVEHESVMISKIFELEDEDISIIKIKYFDTISQLLESNQSIFTDTQFFIVRGIDYNTIKLTFQKNEMSLTGGNPKMRQWFTTQDPELG